MEDNLLRIDGNRYLASKETKSCLFLPPALEDAICGRSRGCDKYYQKKAEYLKLHGFLGVENSEFKYGRLSREVIDASVVETRQVILEITDGCNLECEYCGYGGLYSNYDSRRGVKMDFALFESMMQYLYSTWQKDGGRRSRQTIRITFYGGEPLLNFPFIQRAVEYIESHPFAGKNFVYSMTTNAVLSDRYMSFLAEKDFELLISLDGAKPNHSYRKTHSGENSFDKVFGNVKKMAACYPRYFERRVNFNAVLHNRNSVGEVFEFIRREFGKTPFISELNTAGINPERRKDFWEMFASKTESEKKTLRESDRKAYLGQSQDYIQTLKLVHSLSIKQYNKSLQDLLNLPPGFNAASGGVRVLTGTCIPFSRKIFVSVEGKLYPCERIGNEIDFGRVTKDGVFIAYDNIVSVYNAIYDKYSRKCRKCKASDSCPVCAVSDLDFDRFCGRYDSAWEDERWKEAFAFLQNNKCYKHILTKDRLI